eukprot:scaffold21094_cov110-Isochrysis_galbana.AAC.2
MSTLRSPCPTLSSPYAMAAAVGSLMIRSTFRPAMAPASLVRLGHLLHLDQHHRRDLLGEKGLGLALVLDLDGRPVTVPRDDLEGEVLDVGLGGRIREPAADEALRVEHCVRGVHGRLVLGGVADHSLRVCERNERWGGAVALVVGDDLDAVILPDAYARVRGAKIDADGDVLRHVMNGRIDGSRSR